jgi:hypothetical protein
MTNDTKTHNATNNEQTNTGGEGPKIDSSSPQTPAKEGRKAWINGMTVAYCVAGAVAIAGIGAAAWALTRAPKVVEAAADVAAA